MKNLGLILLCIFISGALFIWFRNSDGSGLSNGTQVKIASLTIWIIFYAIIYIIYAIIYYLKNKK
jgi:hypothetical protein